MKNDFKPKIAAPRKKKAKKRSGPDPQNNSQPYRSGCTSIVQVLQKARTKKIINKTASSNRKNPQKTKQFCVQGC